MICFTFDDPVWPWKAARREGPIFPADLCILWRTANKFRVITRLERGVFVGVSHLHPKGKGSSDPKFLKLPTCPLVWHRGTKLQGDQIRWRVTESTTPTLSGGASVAKICDSTTYAHTVRLDECWCAFYLQQLTFLSNADLRCINKPIRGLQQKASSTRCTDAGIKTTFTHFPFRFSFLIFVNFVHIFWEKKPEKHNT